MFGGLDIISIGDLQVDVFLEMEKAEAEVHCSIHHTECKICFNYADKIPVHKMTKTIAGNATNVAVGSRRLGFKSALMTHIGKDAEARMVQEGLMAERVDMRFVKQDKRTNHSSVINYLGERTIFVYHEPRDYHFPALPKARFIYLTSMGHGWQKIIEPLCKYLDRTGTKLAYNPGTYQLRDGKKVSQPLLDRTEILFVNKEEAALFTEKEFSGKIAPKGELLTELHRLGSRIAVVTDGPQGSYASDASSLYQLGIFDVPAIERTGCGDAFATGFMCAMASGKDIPEAMRWGSFESAGVLQQVGPQAGLLTKKELDYYEHKYPDFKAREMAGYKAHTA